MFSAAGYRSGKCRGGSRIEPIPARSRLGLTAGSLPCVLKKTIPYTTKRHYFIKGLNYSIMEQFKVLIANEHYQFLMMIPAIIGAFYFAWRIIFPDRNNSCKSGSRTRVIACITLTFLGMVCLGYMFSSHLEIQFKNPYLNRVFVWIAGIYVAFFLFFLIALTATDIIRLILRHKTHRNMHGRLFVRISLGIAALITVTGVIHARNIQTVHYELCAGSQLSEPLRIVEVSDLHMGSLIGVHHVQHVADAVNACQPDLVVFLGDQFNRTEAIDVINEEAMFEALSHIEAPLGMYAVIGNHDPELGSEIYQQYLSESGITALDNSVLEILPGNDGRQAEVRALVGASSDGSGAAAAPETPADGAMIVAGRTKLATDPERVPLAELLEEAGVVQGAGSDGMPGAADAGPDENAYYLLVLDHDPDGIAEAVSCDTDLVLAGHSHYGQFYPATLFSRLSYPKGYAYGLAETPNEDTGHITTSIVSSGAGYFQPPIRVGTDTEIVCIDLRPDPQK